MHRYVHVAGIRCLYALLAIITLTLSGRAAQPGADADATAWGRRQLPLAMPPFSPNPSVNLGMIPMWGPYETAQPMQTGRFSPYGYSAPYAGPSNYGGVQASTPSGYPGWGAPARMEANRAEPPWSRLLTASGVANENGRLRWPLGLRILAAPETDELRRQIDALFQEAAIQEMSGPANPQLFQEITDVVQKLRKLLLRDEAERFGMPRSLYRESERFLNQLDQAAKLLKAGLEAPGQERLKTTSPPTPAPPAPAVPKPKG
jgi:hypothetical protein